MKAQRGGKDTTLPKHNLGVWRRWVVNATPRLFTPGKSPGTHFEVSGRLNMSMEHMWHDNDRENPVSVPRCSPQNPHILTRDWTRTSHATTRQLDSNNKQKHEIDNPLFSNRIMTILSKCRAKQTLIYRQLTQSSDTFACQYAKKLHKQHNILYALFWTQFVIKRLHNPQSKRHITRPTLNTHTNVHTPIPEHTGKKTNEMKISIFIFRFNYRYSVTSYKNQHFALPQTDFYNK
jgi:hypothetical protein